MNRKLKALTAVAMSGILALGGCYFVKDANEDGIISDAESNKYDDTIVAEVNGQDMTLADFNFMYYNNASQIQQYYLYMGIVDWEDQDYMGDDPDYVGRTYGDIVREVTLDQMSQFIVAQQKAKEYDILVDEDVVEAADRQKQSLIDQNFGGDETEYENYLDYCFISDYTVEKYMQRSQVIMNLMDRLSQEGEVCAVSEAEVQDKYIKASHVLINIDDDTTDEQALAKANEVVAKLDAGEDMAKLIEEYGEDPGMEQQDYYVFTEGEMVDEFYQGAKALGDNEYTKTPVKTSYGYHVIYRYPLKKGVDGYDEAESYLASEKFSQAMEQWVETASTKIHDDVLDEALKTQREELAAEQEAMLEQQNQSAQQNPTASDGTDAEADAAGTVEGADGAAESDAADANVDGADTADGADSAPVDLDAAQEGTIDLAE